MEAPAVCVEMHTKKVSSTDISLGLQSATKEGWEVVRYKNKHFSSVRCNAGPDVTTLQAVEYRIYIHLWNMSSGADEIRAYLQQLCPDKMCTVEELKPKGIKQKSLKINVPQDRGMKKVFLQKYGLKIMVLRFGLGSG